MESLDLRDKLNREEREPAASLIESDEFKGFVEWLTTEDTTVVLGSLGSGKSLTTMLALHEGYKMRGRNAILAQSTRNLAQSSHATQLWAYGENRVSMQIGGVKIEGTDQHGLTIMTNQVVFNTLVDNFESLMSDSEPLVGHIAFDEFHVNEPNLWLTLGLLTHINQSRQGIGLEPINLTLISGTPNNTILNELGQPPRVELQSNVLPTKLVFEPKNLRSQDKLLTIANRVSTINDSSNSPQLVFLPGGRDMDIVLRDLNTQSTARVYGNTPPAIREAIFTNPPKVIASTGTLRTGVNIQGVMHVHESGRKLTGKFSPDKHINELSNIAVSQIEVYQGANRAGRADEQAYCYTYMTEEEFKRLPTTDTPSIASDDIRHQLLELINLGIDPHTLIENTPGLGSFLILNQDSFSNQINLQLKSLQQLRFLDRDGAITIDGQDALRTRLDTPEVARCLLDMMDREPDLASHYGPQIAALMDRSSYLYQGSELKDTFFSEIIDIWNQYLITPIDLREAFCVQYGIVEHELDRAFTTAESIKENFPNQNFEGAVLVDYDNSLTSRLNPIIVDSFFHNVMIRNNDKYGNRETYSRVGSSGNQRSVKFGGSPPIFTCTSMLQLSSKPGGTVIPSLVFPISPQDIINSTRPNINRRKRYIEISYQDTTDNLKEKIFELAF